jgi:hypothetical protein
MFTHIIYDNDVSALDLHVPDTSTTQLRKGRRDDDDFEDNTPTYLIDYVKEMSKHYDSKHLLMMVGSGLNFERAELYLHQIKGLID